MRSRARTADKASTRRSRGRGRRRGDIPRWHDTAARLPAIVNEVAELLDLITLTAGYDM
ncbi:hypothetical protein ACTWPT_46095 [Nonomuraea sp. 3N208]|uniref:hypothetical protein n=1 Tax=Nonomuraea sp. 3N208 TaxID=3457421 RepID=UPI003FCF25AC